MPIKECYQIPCIVILVTVILQEVDIRDLYV